MTEDVRVSPMLVPRFVTRFSCLKGDCPDTCCFGWDVSVSDEKAGSYQRLANSMGERGAQISQAGAFALANGGRICTQDAGVPCTLLSSDGQCQLWQALGEDALPQTCHNYPRVSHLFGARAEQTISLSCPAAASGALRDDDAFVFEEAVMPHPSGGFPEIGAVAGFDHAIMDDARMLAIQILAGDGLANAEGWVAWGILCEQIEQCAAGAQPERLGMSLQEIVAFVESGEVREVLGRIPADTPAAGAVFAALLGELAACARSEHQRAVMTKATAGLDWAVEAPVNAAGVGRRYAEILAALDGDEQQALDRYLRRFLLNEAFRTGFPWGRQERAMQQLRELVALYGGLRLLLVGTIASTQGTGREDAMAATVQVFARLATHTPSFFIRAEQLLLASGGRRLANLMQLVR